MKLVLAEKPSVAQSIAKVLGAAKREDGYLEGNRFKYRESEMLEVLNMERSTYYDRKKEAILLFGLSLWGTAIPKLKDFLESAREEEALCYCEC